MYQPQPLWRLPEALERMRQMLPTTGEGADLVSLMPLPSGARARSRLQRRAALATTLMAGLELGREGVVPLDQAEASGMVHILPSGHDGPANAPEHTSGL